MTYRHDLSSSAALEIEDGGVEVMQSQFGWGAYAVCECNVNAGQGIDWGAGMMGRRSQQRSGRCYREVLGHMEGREHTIRVSPTQGVPYINGIDGVIMEYLNT